MFGLMKPAKNVVSPQKGKDFRFYYCGTCKAMGKQFGQHTRFTLNYDAVFLGELLNSFTPETTWSKSIQSYNCFNLPSKSEIPAALKYSAAVNVNLAFLKADDHSKDEKGLKKMAFRGLRGGLKSADRKAEALLTEVSPNFEKVNHWISRQTYRETAYQHLNSVEQKLTWFAEPTAQITALVFGNGAKAIDMPELAEKLHTFGFHFGQLTYWLDAFQDLAKDQQSGQFNAYMAATDNQQTVDMMRKSLIAELSVVKNTLQELPLPAAKLEMFQNRLVHNFSLQVGLPVEACEVDTCAEKLSLKEKWALAKAWTKRALHDPQGQLQGIAGFFRGASLKGQQLVLSTFMMTIPDEQFQQLAESQPKVVENANMFDFSPIMLAGMVGALSLLPLMGKMVAPKQVKNDIDDGDDCWGECCASCITACCDACCDSCCDGSDSSSSGYVDPCASDVEQGDSVNG